MKDISNIDLLSGDISQFIKHQFPDYYKEEGGELIALVEAYYNYMSSNNSYNNRMLAEYTDIDDTSDDFLIYFKRKFLSDFPYATKADKRFIIKHALDLYRSKGSEKSLKLLMFMLFGETVDVIYPGNDILRPSDSKWFNQRYIELERSKDNRILIGSRIIGATSGAIADVETVVTKRVGGKLIDIAYLSNLSGILYTGETILTNEDPPRYKTAIIGSMSDIEVADGGFGFSIGDIVDITGGGGVQGTARVKSILDIRDGIDIRLVDGGFGFTLDSDTTIDIDGGAGSGAGFIIGGIKDQEVVNIISDPISPYIDVNLNAVSYGFPSDPTANIESILNTAFTYEYLTIGTISSLAGVDPGSGYNADVDITVTNPLIKSYEIRELFLVVDMTFGSLTIGDIVSQNTGGGIAKGRIVGKRQLSSPDMVELTILPLSFNNMFVLNNELTNSQYTGVGDVIAKTTNNNSLVMGENAIITGVASAISGAIKEVEVVSSGYGYEQDNEIALTSDSTASTASGILSTSRGGVGPGFWETFTSHLNSEKKIRDNDLYQEYSYQISATMSINVYESYVKDILHVAGTKLFGTVNRGSSLSLTINFDSDIDISQVDLPGVIDGSTADDRPGDIIDGGEFNVRYDDIIDGGDDLLERYIFANIGGTLPILPSGFTFVVDSNGNYYRDADGVYYITAIE